METLTCSQSRTRSEIAATHRHAASTSAAWRRSTVGRTALRPTVTTARMDPFGSQRSGENAVKPNSPNRRASVSAFISGRRSALLHSQDNVYVQKCGRPFE
ncbi:hypothetical protein MHYP_G00352450 [Metynnis hypsauchen]